MKKVLCMLLSCVLLLGVSAPLALAVKEAPVSMDGPEIVFFETNFENDEVGKKPKDFSTVVSTAESVVEVFEEDGNKAARFYRSPEATGTGGPRFDERVTIRGLQAFTIEYDVKWTAGDSTFGTYLYGVETGAKLVSFASVYKYDKWTHIKVDVDLKNLLATTYVNGEKTKENSIKEYTDDSVYVRFLGNMHPDGSSVHIDNVKISTRQAGYSVEDSLYINPDSLKAPYNQADALPESGDLITIVDEKFETQTAEELVKTSEGGFKNFAVTNVAPIRVYEANGNKYVKAYHGDPVGSPSNRGPRMGKPIPCRGLNTLTVDMDIKCETVGNSRLGIILYDEFAKKNFVSVYVPTAFKDWTHVKVRFDFGQQKAFVYVAGKLYKEFKAVLTATTMDVRIYGDISADGSDWMLDNVLITTPDKDAGGFVKITGEFDLNQVALKPEEEFGMTKVMRTGHPRIFLHDWQEVRDKVKTDSNHQIWYNNLISTANTMLTTEPAQYVINERGNINTPSTRAKNNMMVLAGAYGLTGDVRYKDRLWKELEHVGGEWPDWDAKTYLCAAHVILGFAIAYDWVYNDWTEEERAKIEGWLIEKGMSQAVIGYEGLLPGISNWINQVSNWSNVCNGSNMIAALALADKYPRLAEYILVKGNSALQACFVEVSADGAYAETVSYWDYGIRHQVKLMAALDTCLAEGQTLPAALDYKNNRGMDKTGDYAIYYNGNVKCFNFGDGASAFSKSPILYWLATKYDKPQYSWYNTYLLNNYEGVTHPTDRSAILSILWYDAEHAATMDPSFALDKFYSSTEPDGANGISMRASWSDRNSMVVMAHAGDATTGHMNHDAGGFVLDWAGKRWVHMYGREPGGFSAGHLYAWPYYHKHYEKGGHYDYYHTRGEANNTIIANPKQDLCDMNVDYYAPMDRFESGVNTAYGIIDMTDTNVDYEVAKRGFMLTDMRETLVVQDEIKAKLPSEFYWFSNTTANINVAADGKSAMLEMDGDRMLVRITQGPSDAKFEVVDARPLPTSPNPDVQAEVLAAINEKKLMIHMVGIENLNLTVEYVPLHEGEGIPAPQAIQPLDAWSVEGSPDMITSQTLGDIVALKVDNPNAYAKGAKTYVDTANLDIMPLVQNGRTLVPVRFIAEKFGAEVGWDDATQTVSVKTSTDEITLQIGSAQMNVNGNITVLDVPAQTIGGRTLIPLRALVEALGKQVFWDDRGLIIISDKPVSFDADTITKLVNLLDIRVQVDGKEVKFFDSEVYSYNIAVMPGAVPTVTASAAAGATVVQGSPATVTVGDKMYTFNFVETP